MRKLNLGCGTKYKEDWVNLDINSNYKADIYHDLNKFPYPFRDNQFDYILLENILEHLDNILDVLNELHRICKDKAVIEITTSFAHSRNFIIDFTHTHTFALNSFNRVCDNAKDGRGYIKGKFDLIEEIPIKGGIGKFLPDFICRRIWNLIQEIYCLLKVKLLVKK